MLSEQQSVAGGFGNVLAEEGVEGLAFFPGEEFGFDGKVEEAAADVRVEAVAVQQAHRVFFGGQQHGAGIAAHVAGQRLQVAPREAVMVAVALVVDVLVAVGQVHAQGPVVGHAREEEHFLGIDVPLVGFPAEDRQRLAVFEVREEED